MREAGLAAVMNMRSRTEPHCVLRVYQDPELARRFEQQAELPSRPYASSDTPEGA